VRTGVVFNVGEVLRHAKYGYRGVVAGWDRRPQLDVSGWDGLRSLPSGAEQPFYRIIPDVADCNELLGGPREMKYVAQENLQRLPPALRRVHHPALVGSLFSHFDPSTATFIPTDELAFAYPGSRSKEREDSATSAEGSEAQRVLDAVRTMAAQLDGFVAAVANHTLRTDAAPRARDSTSPTLDPTGAGRRTNADAGPLADADADHFASTQARAASDAAAASSVQNPTDTDETSASAVSAEEDADVSTFTSDARRHRKPPLFPGGEEVQDHSLGPSRDMMGVLMRFTTRARRVAQGLPSDEAGVNAGGAQRAAGGTRRSGRGRERVAISSDEAADQPSRQLRQSFNAMRELVEVIDFVSVNAAERSAHSDRSEIAFSIGQVLRHKRFGFRAAVFGWERRPQIDVSSWDGVAGLPSGSAQPFYRCVPDMSDCVSLLGGPRGVRYVAQENLEPLSDVSERAISHELLPQVFERYDEASGNFVPVQQLRYWYPLDSPSNDDAPLARAVHSLERLQVLLNTHALDAKRSGLLGPMLNLLKAARTFDDAADVERVVNMVFSAHEDTRLMMLLQQSRAAVDCGEFESALRTLHAALDADRTHAQTWFMLASVHSRDGAHEESMRAAEQCLQLEPRHFGALAARGAALRGLRRYDEALDSYEMALAAHPWALGTATAIYKARRAVELRGGRRVNASFGGGA